MAYLCYSKCVWFEWNVIFPFFLILFFTVKKKMLVNTLSVEGNIQNMQQEVSTHMQHTNNHTELVLNSVFSNNNSQNDSF